MKPWQCRRRPNATSPRCGPFPERLQELEYAPGYMVRRVRSNGEVRWQRGLVYLSEALVDQWVGLIEIDNGQWRVDFGPIQLAIYQEQDKKFKPIRC